MLLMFRLYADGKQVHEELYTKPEHSDEAFRLLDDMIGGQHPAYCQEYTYWEHVDGWQVPVEMSAGGLDTVGEWLLDHYEPTFFRLVGSDRSMMPDPHLYDRFQLLEPAVSRST